MSVATPDGRSAYATPRGARGKAFLVTLLIHAVVFTGLVVRFSISPAPGPPSAPLVVTLLPLAAPPEPQRTERKKPLPEPRKKPPIPPRIVPVDRTVTPLAPVAASSPPPDAPPADPAPRLAETAAPMATPAPPAPQPRSDAPDSWEGRVLARLERFRRYPDAARSARQQGVAYIRFRIDRAGHVLSSSLVRGSGVPALDRAALDTLRRADPLPAIPADRPDQIELVVPVEFYLR